VNATAKALWLAIAVQVLILFGCLTYEGSNVDYRGGLCRHWEMGRFEATVCSFGGVE
jgi:hypothetical protein